MEQVETWTNEDWSIITPPNDGEMTPRRPKREPLSVVDIHSFLAMEIPPREWMLKPWLPCQGLAMVYARRGTGKTYLGLAIGYAVASGGTVLGWQAPRPRKVLYVDGEMLAAPLQERLAALVRAADREAAAGMFNIITLDLQKRGMPDLATLDGQASLADITPPDTSLIIVDSLSSLVRGEGHENDAESWLPIEEWTLHQRVHGRSVLFLHHANKSGGQRGTSKREDLLDTVLVLRPPTDHDPQNGARFEVRMEKSRHRCEEFREIEAELIEADSGGVTWTCRALGETTAERIRQMHDDGMSKAEIAKELGVNRSTVYRTLKRVGG